MEITDIQTLCVDTCSHLQIRASLSFWKNRALTEPIYLLDEARFWKDDLLSSLLIKKVGQQ